MNRCCAGGLVSAVVKASFNKSYWRCRCRAAGCREFLIDCRINKEALGTEEVPARNSNNKGRDNYDRSSVHLRISFRKFSALASLCAYAFQPLNDSLLEKYSRRFGRSAIESMEGRVQQDPIGAIWQRKEQHLIVLMQASLQKRLRQPRVKLRQRSKPELCSLAVREDSPRQVSPICAQDRRPKGGREAAPAIP